MGGSDQAEWNWQGNRCNRNGCRV